jgi:hypothetical protein
MARERIHHATDNRAIAGMVIYPDSVKNLQSRMRATLTLEFP